MGSVFLAEKASTGEPFAIKFLRQDCMDDPAYLTRFDREVTSLRAIRHPNVVHVYAWSIPQSVDSDERPFVIMEYLDGEGLDKIIAREKKLDALAATRIMLQVLDGLAAAHQIGVVHRDLGPSNVFLMPRQRGRFHVKILDFGLARSLNVSEQQSELTQQGTLMGKPAYVAPEALTGQAIDGRSDIFACGVLMFRMLTGAFPYKESDSHMLWVERLRDARSETEYPPPSSLVPDVPEVLDRIVCKAMRTRVNDRYTTVEVMQEELLEVETSLVGEDPSRADYSSSRPGIPRLGEASQSSIQPRSRGTGVDATPTAGPVSKTAVRKRRRVALAAAGAAAVAVAVAVVLLVAFRGGGDRRSNETPGAGQGTTVAVGPGADVLDEDAGLGVKASQDDAGTPDVGAVKVVPDVVEQGEADAPAEAPPAQVLVVVRGVPRGATVQVGGVALTGDPPAGFVPVSSEGELVVEARGYSPWREVVALDEDREFTVRLHRTGGDVSGGRDGGRITVHTIPSVPDEPF